MIWLFSASVWRMLSGTDTAPSRANGEQHDDKFDAVAEHHGDAIALLDPERP